MLLIDYSHPLLSKYFGLEGKINDLLIITSTKNVSWILESAGSSFACQVRLVSTSGENDPTMKATQ